MVFNGPKTITVKPEISTGIYRRRFCHYHQSLSCSRSLATTWNEVVLHIHQGYHGRSKRLAS